LLTFEELDLIPEIQKALAKIGFEKPTEIQEKAIPALKEYPTDFIGLARTGTGKTAAFGLPLLNQIKIKDKHVQGVIIAPTRELVQQIAKELNNFGQYMKGLRITSVYGGASIVGQMKEIRKEKPQIIVASPGRLIDLAGRGVVKLDKIGTVILDEADEMLNMGFQEDIDKILEYTPEHKQTWLFSATMPPFIKKITKTYMTDHVEIAIKSDQKTNENIQHQYVVVKRRDKLEALKRFIDSNPNMYAVVFCRTRRDTMEVSDRLNAQGYAADALHGELSQSQRDAVMARFRSKKNQVLFATDVAARGIDVNDITHVFHLELPDTIEYYTHRSGRTARAGKTGISLILITNRDFRKIRSLEKNLKIEIAKVDVPDYNEVINVRINSWIEKLKNEEVDHAAVEYYNDFAANFEDLTKEEILLKLLSREMSAVKSKSSNDINEDGMGRADRARGGDSKWENNKRGGRDRDRGRGRERKRDSRDRKGEAREDRHKGKKPEKRVKKGKANGKGDHSEMFINIGKMDYVSKAELLKIICQKSGLESSDIGSIEISKRHSIFQLDKKFAKDHGNFFKPFKLKGRQIRVNPA